MSLDVWKTNIITAGGNRKSASLTSPYSVVGRSPKKTEVLGIATGTLLEALEQRIIMLQS